MKTVLQVLERSRQSGHINNVLIDYTIKAVRNLACEMDEPNAEFLNALLIDSARRLQDCKVSRIKEAKDIAVWINSLQC